MLLTQKRIHCFLLMLPAVVALDFSCIGQVDSSYQKLLEETKAFYGSNDLLNYGKQYYRTNYHAKGTPYLYEQDLSASRKKKSSQEGFSEDDFKKNEWDMPTEYIPSTLYVQNHTFTNVPLKYNIQLEQLILKAELNTDYNIELCTDELWVDGFDMAGHHFVNAKRLYGIENAKGYYEEAFKGKTVFFIKYKKDFSAVGDAYTPYGYFYGFRRNFFILKNKQLEEVSSVKKFLQSAGIHKKEVKRFMKDNKINYTKASVKQLNQLMNFYDNLPQ